MSPPYLRLRRRRRRRRCYRRRRRDTDDRRCEPAQSARVRDFSATGALHCSIFAHTATTGLAAAAAAAAAVAVVQAIVSAGAAGWEGKGWERGGVGGAGVTQLNDIDRRPQLREEREVSKAWSTRSEQSGVRKAVSTYTRPLGLSFEETTINCVSAAEALTCGRKPRS